MATLDPRPTTSSTTGTSGWRDAENRPLASQAFNMFLLRIYDVFTMYLLCIYYVFTMFLLRIYDVFTMYLLCIYHEFMYWPLASQACRRTCHLRI